MSAGLWSLDPDFRPYAQAFIDAVREAGITVQITSTRRSTALQSKLYEAYKRGQSPYPAAPPGHSQHNLGLAFDMDVDDRSVLPILGEIWESLGKGFRWGGRFRDPVHFDYKT